MWKASQLSVQCIAHVSAYTHHLLTVRNYHDITSTTGLIRLALSKTHTSARTIDVAEVFLLNKRPLTPILPCSVWWCFHPTLP